jgi:2-amino-4-hydroxy-6-hydroxymethyldihydropteridine diphosphokinase
MHTAYIGMGSNLPSTAGPPEATLCAAADRLQQIGQMVSRSSLYSTEPLGFAGQPRFVNAVVGVKTAMAPRDLLENLLTIEREFGRNRSTGIANGPRTLDLDLLLLGNLIMNEPGLEIPHPRLADRAFVLVPLNEIASNLVVVTQRKTVKELLHGLPRGVPTESDAVLPLQYPQWNSGPCGHDSLRADSPDPHGHR